MQSNALEKLKARETLNQSGQIELKVKLDKHIKKNHPELVMSNFNIRARWRSVLKTVKIQNINVFPVQIK